jgi:hypothetical protein
VYLLLAQQDGVTLYESDLQSIDCGLIAALLAHLLHTNCFWHTIHTGWYSL